MIKAHQVRAGLRASGDRGLSMPVPKLDSRRQVRLHSIMLSSKVSAGRGGMEAAISGESGGWW